MSTIYLTVPGITNSSENHWQSRWEREWPGKFRRIEQAEWDTPDVNDWIAKIESDVRAAGPENVILVAHSLGCIAVAHWAKKFGTTVKGVFLVGPSDCETEKYSSTFASTGFDPIPLDRLPFLSIVVASTNDEWVAFGRAKQFADAWGSEFADVGDKGHINPGSGYGEWNEGLELLKRLG
jgi:predicted alpha/beta hydrolase family esterase